MCGEIKLPMPVEGRDVTNLASLRVRVQGGDDQKAGEDLLT